MSVIFHKIHDAYAAAREQVDGRVIDSIRLRQPREYSEQKKLDVQVEAHYNRGSNNLRSVGVTIYHHRNKALSYEEIVDILSYCGAYHKANIFNRRRGNPDELIAVDRRKRNVSSTFGNDYEKRTIRFDEGRGEPFSIERIALVHMLKAYRTSEPIWTHLSVSGKDRVSIRTAKGSSSPHVIGFQESIGYLTSLLGHLNALELEVIETHVQSYTGIELEDLPFEVREVNVVSGERLIPRFAEVREGKRDSDRLLTRYVQLMFGWKKAKTEKVNIQL